LYLGYSNRLSIGCAPDVSPAPDFSGAGARGSGAGDAEGWANVGGADACDNEGVGAGGTSASDDEGGGVVDDEGARSRGAGASDDDREPGAGGAGARGEWHLLIQDMPTQLETVTINVLLGVDGAHADGAEPRPSDAAGSDVPVSHLKIFISECEPFFQKKFKFSEGFYLFSFKMNL
jgi:hypothetical protein